MSAYDLHAQGNCWPDTCPICAQECDGCGEWHDRCTCPVLPIDIEEPA